MCTYTPLKIDESETKQRRKRISLKIWADWKSMLNEKPVVMYINTAIIMNIKSSWIGNILSGIEIFALWWTELLIDILSGWKEIDILITVCWKTEASCKWRDLPYNFTLHNQVEFLTTASFGKIEIFQLRELSFRLFAFVEIQWPARRRNDELLSFAYYKIRYLWWVILNQVLKDRTMAKTSSRSRIDDYMTVARNFFYYFDLVGFGNTWIVSFERSEDVKTRKPWASAM